MMEWWQKYHAELADQYVTLSGIARLLSPVDDLPAMGTDQVLKIMKASGSMIPKVEKLLIQLTFVRGGQYQGEIKVALSKLMRSIILSSKVRDALGHRISREEGADVVLSVCRDYQGIIIDTYYTIGRLLIIQLPPGCVPRSEFDLYVAPFQDRSKMLPPSA